MLSSPIPNDMFPLSLSYNEPSSPPLQHLPTMSIFGNGMAHCRRPSVASSTLDEGYSSGASTSLDMSSPIDVDCELGMESLGLSSPLSASSAMEDLTLYDTSSLELYGRSPSQSFQRPQSLHGFGVTGTENNRDYSSVPVVPSNAMPFMPRRVSGLQPIIVPTRQRRSLPHVPTVGSSPVAPYVVRRASIANTNSPLSSSSGTLPALPSPSSPATIPVERAASLSPGAVHQVRSPVPPSALGRRFSVPFVPNMSNVSSYAMNTPYYGAPSMYSPTVPSASPSVHSPFQTLPYHPTSALAPPSPPIPPATEPTQPKQYVFVNEDPSVEPLEIPAFIDPQSGDAKIDENIISLYDLEHLEDTDLQQALGFGAKFKCVCGKLFEKLASLKSHARLHKAERNHVCDVCQRAFVRRQDLKRHKATHNTDFKPYECTNCGTTFTRSDALHRHLKAKRCL
ncbi:hypothetical protein SpCBS45565_g07538 [Spizellomyces sp. 'palustris']|nr:hypothetical protein SpCBS45565_g07538 [Spizellomyces sp. 'palustris']